MANNPNFLVLFSWHERLRVDLLSRYSVKGGFQIEWFMLLGVIGCYGGGKGITVTSMCRIVNTYENGVMHRALEKRLFKLLKYGYVVRVKRGRFFYYSLSSHAEKLLREAVGVKELKRLNSHVRLLLKS